MDIVETTICDKTEAKIALYENIASRGLLRQKQVRPIIIRHTRIIIVRQEKEFFP